MLLRYIVKKTTRAVAYGVQRGMSAALTIVAIVADKYVMPRGWWKSSNATKPQPMRETPPVPAAPDIWVATEHGNEDEGWQDVTFERHPVMLPPKLVGKAHVHAVAETLPPHVASDEDPKDIL